MVHKDKIDLILAEARNQTDPLADKAVQLIVGSGQLDSANALFGRLMRNNDVIPERAPAEVKAYLEESGHLPGWLDPEKVRRGERFFSLWGPECMTVLLFKSLPEGYAQRHVAETLAVTGRMRSHRGHIDLLTRRILETLQFVINVMTPGGLASKDAIGIQTAQRVRLIHAAIRGYVEDSPKWDADGPKPINQAELAMTVLSFSLLVIQGLERLNVRLSREDSEAVLHMWKVVGFVLGVRDELLTDDLDEAQFLWDEIVETDGGGSEAGVDLTASLIEYGKSIMPFKFFRFLPRFFIRHYVPPHVCKMLKVRCVWNPLALTTVLALKLLVAMMQRADKRWKWFAYVHRRFHIWLLQNLLSMWNHHKQVHFYIPPSLTRDWGLK